MTNFDVSLSSAGGSNDRLAFRKELLEQARAGDVIGVHMGVHAELELQTELTNSLGISVCCLDDLKVEKKN